ncbi:polysaccharide biosynthesis tyrosine autokinase [Georgenia sp. 10Sc9-8]|uniref:Polysaccharide biosynthesis tyrosine autokinase n=1 Tax=Georgenia halotolerans TaxID=3028317 RepID=A0ABT5U072_9MICO|nr:polysaccharide biosynthesis tyrosine autokinase [Georgenia halotolerans]
MELTDYLAVLRKHAVALGVILALCIGATLWQTARTEPTYEASSSVFLSLQGGESVSELVQGSTYVHNLVRSYSEIATMPIVLEPVAEELDLDISPQVLSRSVTAQAPLDTSIIEITVAAPSAEGSADIANAIAAQLSTTAGNLSASEATDSARIRMTTVDSAAAPDDPVSPRIELNLALGILIGLVLSMGYVVVRELLDTQVRTESDVQRVVDAPILGTVSSHPQAKGNPVLVRDDPFGAPAESFRHLRTKLQFVNATRGTNALVITSALPAEGKSLVSVNLAETYALGGRSVLLIDADLRRPSLARSLGLEGNAGLTNLLVGEATLEELRQSGGNDKVSVLSSGPLPPNPSELLGSERMVALLDQARRDFDVVILDSAPLVPVSDSAELAHLVGAVLLVVKAGRARRHHIRASLDLLGSSGAQLAGVVLNDTSRKPLQPYGYAPEASDTTSPAAGRRTTRRRLHRRP